MPKLFWILAILENVILYVYENLPNNIFFAFYSSLWGIVRHMNLQALLFNRSYFHENSSTMAVFFSSSLILLYTYILYNYKLLLTIKLKSLGTFVLLSLVWFKKNWSVFGLGLRLPKWYQQKSFNVSFCPILTIHMWLQKHTRGKT